MTHLLVARVEHQELEPTQRSRAPLLQLGVEQLGCPRYIRGAHLQAAQLARDLRHTSGGHALDVHLRHGQSECPLASLALLEALGIEARTVLDIANLRHLQGHLAHARLHGLGLVAVGVATASVRAFVQVGPEEAAALELHRFVHEHGDRTGHSLESLFSQHGEYPIDGRTILVVGHVVSSLRFARPADGIGADRPLLVPWRRGRPPSCFSSLRSLQQEGGRPCNVGELLTERTVRPQHQD